MQNSKKVKMLENEETWLPSFPGFYNTLYEFDYEYELYNYNEDQDGNEIRKQYGYDRDIEYDDLKIDHQQYEFDVVSSYIAVIENELNNILNGIKIQFEKIISPREYNFANDSVNVSIDVPVKPLQEYIHENYEEFTEYIKNRYTSCSGFMSYYSNNADVWKQETNNFQEFPNHHYLGSILDFICNREINEMDVYERTMDNIYTGNYIDLKPCTDNE